MIIEVAKLTRLSTSYGTDADSWMADFGLIARIGAVASTGQVTFARYTAGGAAPVIPVGATVKSAGRTALNRSPFYADTTNPAFSPVAGGLGAPGYIMPPEIASIDVPVQALVAGAAGNAGAATISQITSAIPGVDTVTNLSAFVTGSDFETDDGLKDRFRLAIASLSKATDAAITLAVTSIQTGMQVAIRDGYDLNGNFMPGMVSVIVDDGSGSPSNALVMACRIAVDAVRAAGVRIGVYGAQIVPAAVSVSFNTAPGYYAPMVEAQVTATIAAKINGLGLGQGLSYFDLAAWTKAVPGVAAITTLVLNNGVADMPADPRYTIKAANIATA